jgi:membrane associated rhomboid family serine protease
MLRKVSTATPWLTLAIVTTMATLFWWADGSTNLWLNPEDHGVGRLVAASTAVASHADMAHLASNAVMLLLAGSIAEVGLSRWWLPLCYAAAVGDNLLGDSGVRHVGASGMLYALVGVALVGWVRHLVGAQTAPDPTVRQNTAVGGAGLLAVLAPYPVYDDIRQMLSPNEAWAPIVADNAGHLRMLCFGLIVAGVCYARYIPGVCRHIRAVVRTQWRTTKPAR